MISSLTGPFTPLGAGAVSVAVGGVGIRVEVPAAVAHGAVREVVTLHTSLVVREDSLTLFGFPTPGERDAFEILLSVSGVGPRLALAALETVGLERLHAAVLSEDLKVLQEVPGVGKKTAQRLALEIGDKLSAVAPTPAAGTVPASPVRTGEAETVVAALEGLGWPRPVAERVVDQVDSGGSSAETLLRSALARLGGTHG